MRIVCPQCGYSRDIPTDKVPATSSIATCPKCHFRFRFRGHQPPSRPEMGDDEPVYPPRPSRPASSGPAAVAFEPRSQRIYAPDETTDHIDQSPPRPQARWLPDPEPDGRGPRSARSEGPEEVSPAHPPVPPLSPDLEEEPLPPWERPARPLRSGPMRRPDKELVADHAEGSPLFDAGETRRPVPDMPQPQEAHYGPGQPGILQGDEEPSEAPRADETGDLAGQPEEDPASPDAPGAMSGSDSVRDIWSRLQAMGTETKVAAGQDRAGKEEAPPKEAPSHPDTAVPWESLEHYGVVPAFMGTIKNILIAPGDFFDQLPPMAGKVRPLIFALALSIVAMVFVLVWDYFGLKLGGLRDLGHTEGFQGLGGGAIGGLALLGLAPILTGAFVLLDSALSHLLLGLLRAATKSFDETFRTVCYAGGPWVLAVLPVPYSYLIPIVLIWHMTLQAIGLRKLHQTGYPQVLASVLVKWSLYFMASFAVLHVLMTRG